jgi:hypothetical protein
MTWDNISCDMNTIGGRWPASATATATARVATVDVRRLHSTSLLPTPQASSIWPHPAPRFLYCSVRPSPRDAFDAALSQTYYCPFARLVPAQAVVADTTTPARGLVVATGGAGGALARRSPLCAPPGAAGAASRGGGRGGGGGGTSQRGSPTHTAAASPRRDEDDVWRALRVPTRVRVEFENEQENASGSGTGGGGGHSDAARARATAVPRARPLSPPRTGVPAAAVVAVPVVTR